MKKLALLIFTLLSIVQTNSFGQNRLYSRLFYLKPHLHHSITKFYSTKFQSFTFHVHDPVDNRVSFIGEKFYKNHKVKYYQDYWDRPLIENIKEKMLSDLKMNNVLLFAKQDNVKNIELYPEIEIFYPYVKGFIIAKSFAKVRLKMKVEMDNIEIMNQKYEAFYMTRGYDDEWEGKQFETIENGANITVGVALRKVLDKFYSDLEKKLI